MGWHSSTSSCRKWSPCRPRSWRNSQSRSADKLVKLLATVRDDLNALDIDADRFRRAAAGQALGHLTSGASSVGRRTEVPMARCSERRDLAGSRVVARAIARADHRDLTYHWILDAVENVWMQTVEDVRLARNGSSP